MPRKIIKPVQRVNKSNSSTLAKDSKIYKAIDKVFSDGGTITYYFVEKRIKFTQEHPDGEEVEHKTVLKSDISSNIFYNTIGSKKSKQVMMKY